MVTSRTDTDPRMMVSFLGLPGTGKSWLARQLRARLSGVILSGRDLAKAMNHRGSAACPTTDPQFVNGLREALRSVALGPLVLLDGIPRTHLQAAAMVDMSRQQEKLSPCLVFSLSLRWPSQKELPLLLCGRTLCPQCERTFDPVVSPPRVPGLCDTCGNRLVVKNELSLNQWSRKVKHQADQLSEIRQYLEQQPDIRCFAVSVDIRNKQSCLKGILRHIGVANPDSRNGN